MYFIGDGHGKFGDLKRIWDRLAPARCMQLGDMGFGFVHEDEFRACQNLSFIRGNHDNPSVCRQYAYYLGDCGYLDGEGIFFVRTCQQLTWRRAFLLRANVAAVSVPPAACVGRPT